MLITFCFAIGNVDEVMSTPTGFPYIQVFYNTTESLAGATAMSSFILFLGICQLLTTVATASRQLYAFARDLGVPFAPWVSKVYRDLPIPALLITFILSSLLSLINIGSAAALNSITSLGSVAMLSSYICSIGCIAWRRFTKSPLPDSKFKLGRFGLLINAIALMFLLVMFVLCFFPLVPNPSPASMNWNILIYGAVITFSLIYFAFSGRHSYVGPIEYVRKLE